MTVSGVVVLSLLFISLAFAVNKCDRFFSSFFFQAEDGIRDLVRSRGLGDVYKRQGEQVELPQQAELMKPAECTQMKSCRPEAAARKRLSLIHI